MSSPEHSDIRAVCSGVFNIIIVIIIVRSDSRAELWLQSERTTLVRCLYNMIRCYVGICWNWQSSCLHRNPIRTIMEMFVKIRNFHKLHKIFISSNFFVLRAKQKGFCSLSCISHDFSTCFRAEIFSHHVNISSTSFGAFLNTSGMREISPFLD
jgi:hypothetical protein